MHPINVLMLNLYATVSDSEDRVDVRDLHRSAMKLKRDVLELLGTHMTPKNKKKVAGVVDMIASLDFLTNLCEGEEMASHKEVIREDLKDMLAPLLMQREEEDECKFSTCTVKEVSSASPTFRSLNYCPKHHQKKYQNLLTDPTISHFFTDDKDCTIFEAFMTKHLPNNMLALYKGLNNYTRSPKRVRGPFARALWDKYFDVRATHPVTDIPEDMLIEVKAALQSPDTGTFMAVQTICTANVDRVFVIFCGSEEFKEYMKMLELPEYLAAGIRATVIEKMKASEQFLEQLDEEKDFDSSSMSSLNASFTDFDSSLMSSTSTTAGSSPPTVDDAF